MKRTLNIIAIILVCSSCNIYQKSSQNYVSKIANGELKKVGSFHTKKANKSDQYSYYQRWDNVWMEYRETGEIKSISISHFKVGTYGKPCKELLNKYTEFNASGIKVYERKDVCDCKTSTVKEYNDKGQLISKKVVKTKRIK
jgi:hypothetical protein